MTIKPDDFTPAIAYCRRLRDRLGATAFLQLVAVKTPTDLDAWISQWLTETDIERLDLAIRQARYRQRHRGNHVRLVVNATTAKALRQRANQSGTTVSHLLEQFANGGTHP